MIKTVRFGKVKHSEEVSIVETPGIGRGKENKERKFLLIFSSDKIYGTREELQKLNEAIAEIISEEINKDE